MGTKPETRPLAILALAAVLGSSAARADDAPEAEFHMARLVYSSNQGERAWRPWWAIDYPEAELHLTNGLRRLTAVDVAGDSRHLSLMDEEIFDYPWLFAQQAGRWFLDDAETDRLREYVLRGGFVVVDDFHGEFDWQVMSEALRRAFPEWPIERLAVSHPLMATVYELNQDTQIPGRRHLYRAADGSIDARLWGPAEWHGIHDDSGRLVVAINYNMDMGDAWEHADDPVYPVPMTSLAYRFAVNYVVYAMTH